jgi:hypothetical protein
MLLVQRWAGSLCRAMKATGFMFKMDKFRVGADNCDTTEIVGDAGMMANICETHFRTVIGKTLDEVNVPQPDWKTASYKENIRNVWGTYADMFLRALRASHELIKCRLQLSITGGNNTKFSAWTDSFGCFGKNYTIEDLISSIAESEGHTVHDITTASGKTFSDAFN